MHIDSVKPLVDSLQCWFPITAAYRTTFALHSFWWWAFECVWCWSETRAPVSECRERITGHTHPRRAVLPYSAWSWPTWCWTCSFCDVLRIRGDTFCIRIVWISGVAEWDRSPFFCVPLWGRNGNTVHRDQRTFWAISPLRAIVVRFVTWFVVSVPVQISTN